MDRRAPPERARAAAAPSSTYKEVASYTKYEELVKWAKPSVGQTTLVNGGASLDASSVRFSVLSTTGMPLVTGYAAVTSLPGKIPNAVAAHFGANEVLVAWTNIQGTVNTIRGRVFECK